MTPNPQDDAEARTSEPSESPLENGDAGRHVAHLTGMTPESAETFASFHSGRFAPFHRAS
jgi:hypothetical protein